MDKALIRKHLADLDFSDLEKYNKRDQNGVTISSQSFDKTVHLLQEIVRKGSGLSVHNTNDLSKLAKKALKQLKC